MPARPTGTVEGFTVIGGQLIASVGETRVARGAKIDNLATVGHGSEVGENTLLCAQVGLAGSTVVGKDVILAGQAGGAGHCPRRSTKAAARSEPSSS